MGRDYWGQFLKDSEKVVRDTNDIIRKNYETIVENFGDETRRMIKRIDCLNKLIDMELQLKTESTESSIPDEKKKQFLEIMETVHRIVDSLQNINALCNPLIGEQPHVNPGAHESDISRLETDRENLRNQIICFRQTVVGSENVFAPQLTFLTQVESILQGRALRTICFELRNVIDGGDSESVKKYGGWAEAILQQMDGHICMLDWELKNDNGSYQLLPAEPEGDNNTTLF